MNSKGSSRRTQTHAYVMTKPAEQALRVHRRRDFDRAHSWHSICFVPEVKKDRTPGTREQDRSYVFVENV